MYEVSVERVFSAAHSLRGYAGCCENLHGHNWRVEATVRATVLDELGLAVDFRVLKQALDDALAPLDHGHLNEIPPFDQTNPSCENIARHLYDQLSAALNNDRVRVARVRVWESEGSSAMFDGV
jgi:6-pyruvoyltetrahydropterin/6-carboxytetrahydropterin synthase